MGIRRHFTQDYFKTLIRHSELLEMKKISSYTYVKQSIFKSPLHVNSEAFAGKLHIQKPYLEKKSKDEFPIRRLEVGRVPALLDQ